MPERNVPDREPPAPRTSSAAFDWRTRVAITLGTWVLYALGATWRVKVHGRQALLDRAPEDSRVVFTLWHGQMLPILWAHRQPTGVMISEHKDGEIIARIVGTFGFFGVRGSSSRGGTRALLEAVQVLKRGADMAITPDGPRGPRYSFAPGALVLAHRAGAPVVSLVAHVDRKWQLRSWDGFEIPKPFARVTIEYGEPVVLDDPDVRAAAARTEAFAQRMRDAVARVERLSNASTRA
ncbi:lysophospholipid acyltransferase family protein [Gemmatimonas sp.]|uniref:lysophospholipid acyltransferase family protein n=1 Tax=Gemmatimonas sp. TaxID=1962908 RepID=UPI00286EA7A5|nr:lysophospholipid acyltransferase family protein [Gemmatimonas sp.]